MAARLSSPRTAALLVALLFGAGALYALRLGAGLRYPDERDYVALARHLAQGAGYTLDGATPTAYRPPVYPLLLAGLARLGGGPVAFRLLNMAALAAAALLVYRLARRVTSPAAAFLATAAFALYPLNLYTAGTLYPQTLATLLLLLALALATAPPPLGAGRAAALGACLALLVLAVPTCAIPAAALGAWALWQRATGLPRLTAALALLIGLQLVAAPWLLRNARAFGAFVPVSTNSGLNLLIGNAPDATPTAGVNVDLAPYQAPVAGLPEPARDAALAQTALALMRADPARTARRYLLKVLNHFNVHNTLQTAAESSRGREWLLGLCYYPLLLAAGVRAYRVGCGPPGPARADARLFAALYLLAALAQAVFFTRIRFRVPFDPLLILLAALPAPPRARPPPAAAPSPAAAARSVRG